MKIRADRSQPQQYNASGRAVGEGDNLSKVEVKCHHDPLLVRRMAEDVLVGRGRVSGIKSMNRIVPFGPKPFRDRSRQVHVDQKAHLRTLG